MRAFLAIPLKKELLFHIQKGLKLKEGRLLSSFHITLFFFGDVKESILHKIIDIVSSSMLLPMKIESEKLILLPKRNPRVIAVKYNSHALVKNFNLLYPQMNKILNVNKRLIPHASIARINRNSVYKINNIPKYEENPNKIVLYESILEKTGARYRELRVWNL